MIIKITPKKQRAISKGYKVLKKKQQLHLLLNLEEVLTNTPLKNVKLNKFCLNNGIDVELSARQFLTTKVLGSKFNKSFLYSIGSNTPFRYPLPKEWRYALIHQGVNVDRFNCALLWVAYNIASFGKGVLYGLKDVFTLCNESQNLKNHVYFDSLVNSVNGRCISSNPNRNNIINWYLQWKNRAIEIDNICHSVDNQPSFKLGAINIIKTGELPILDKFELLRYFIYIVYLSVYNFITLPFSLYRGLLLKEIIKVKRVILANENRLAQDYLFNNSSAIYRPMWTYVVENKSSRVLFYFYSVNDEYFKKNDKYVLYNPLHLMNWPYFLAWDKYHIAFIKRVSRNNPVIEEVGVTWFSSNEKHIDIPLNSIAVFDVTPAKLSVYITIGAPFEYRIYSVCNQFLTDIHTVLSKNNINMMCKTKRIHKTKCKKYLKRLKQLNKELYYKEIHPSVDPMQVIQKTKACISAPFTSTAIIAKLEGKPSVYYDPSGLIQKDDRAAHGVPIIVGVEELRQWVEQIK